jgi:PAS domain S-box-containing protein
MFSPIDIKVAFVVLAVIILLIFLWVYLLRKQVKYKTKQLNDQLKTIHNQNEQLNGYKTNLEKMVSQKTGDLEKAMKELEDSQIILNSFILQSIEGITITDESGKIIIWNERISEITGIPREVALTKYNWEIEFELYKNMQISLSIDAIKKRINQYYQHLQGNSISVNTSQIKTRKGEIKYIESVVFLIKTNNRKFYGQILKDITDKKKIEAELELYQVKLERLLASQTEKSLVLSQHLNYVFENASDYIAIFEISNNKIILANCNANWARSLGSNIAELVGKPVEKIFNSNSIAKIFVIDSFNKKQTSFLESIEFIENNEIKYLDITAIPISELSDQVALFARDVTNRKLEYNQLQESENKFSNIFNNSLDIITLIDYETKKYIDVNNAYFSAIGFSKEDVIGKTREELNMWYNLNEMNQYYKLLEQYNRVQNIELQWMAQKIPKHFLVSTEVIMLNSRKALLTTSRDIDDFKKVSIALQESEEKFRNIFNSSADVIIILDFNKRIIDTNVTFYEPLGYTRDEAINANSYLDFVKPDYFNILNERFELLKKGIEVPILEVEIVSKSGAYNYFELKSKIISYGNEKVVLVLARDIAERKKMEQKILVATIEAEERERRKLAADLHDEVGPLLSSMNMNLSLLARKQKENENKEMIDEITFILKNTIGTVREISHNISPQVLSTYGLASAINAFISDKKKIIAINFENTIGNKRFMEVKELMLYRIVKELVNNTLKYANASEINMKLDILANNNVQFCFRDNGMGFNTSELSLKPNKGLGLLNIINRVNTIGGWYNLNSSPGKGFLIEVTFKIEN